MINGANSDQTPFDIDENDLEDIIGQVPCLLRIRDFTKSIARTNWFSDVGTPLSASVRHAAQAYLDSLGFPDLAIVPVRDWAEAAELAENPDFDTESWQAEEQMRAHFETQALEHADPDALSVALNHLHTVITASAEQAIEDAAALWDITDDELLTAALGAAHQTCHTYALGLLSEDLDEQSITPKIQLFQMGRWPISITGASFNLF